MSSDALDTPGTEMTLASTIAEMRKTEIQIAMMEGWPHETWNERLALPDKILHELQMDRLHETIPVQKWLGLYTVYKYWVEE